MKKLTLFALIGTLVTYPVVASQKQNPLDVAFADSNWNGKEVPLGQQCQKFGGKSPSTPKLKIRNIPNGTTAIVMEYSDRAYKPMDNGGHGKLGYRVSANIKEVLVPAIAGHSFNLPDNVFSISAHRGPDWDKAGAYMPPCSGGNKHPYHVTVKAVKQTGEKMTVLAQTRLEMGLY